MPSDQLDVPALPVLIPLGLLLMAFSGIVLHRRGRLTPRRLVTAWAAGWYVVAVLGATLLPLHLSWGPWSGPPDLYRIILVPLVTMRISDFVLNTAMTLPMAALLFLVAGIRSRRRVVLIAFLISLTIEVTQAVLVLWFGGNRWADVNDLMSNTLGAFLGHLWFWRLMSTVETRRRVSRWAITDAEEVGADPGRLSRRRGT